MTENSQCLNNDGISINVVIMAKLAYPKGMAGTKRIQHFIDYLQSHDISVALLLLSRGNDGIGKNEVTGCYKGTYYRRIGNNLNLNLSLAWCMPIFVWNGFKCLMDWKKKNHKNVLLCYGGPNIENICFIFFAKLLGYKIIFDIVEDYSVIDHEVKRLTKIKICSLIFLTNRIRFLADGLVVISSHLYDKYSGSVRHKDAIKLIPVSAKVEEAGCKEKFNSPVRIAYSGSFGWKDGVEDLIDAFESLQRQRKNIILQLTGKGTKEDVDRIKRKILGNEDIFYLGYLDDDEFYNFLREADILCMTRISSNYANAGFPFKLGEYLATGNPVIASACSDVCYYLDDMKDAVLTKPGDVGEIENALNYLLNEQETAIKIGWSGREKCRRYFNPAKNGRLLMGLLKLI